MNVKSFFSRHPKLRAAALVAAGALIAAALLKDFVLKQCVQSAATDILGTTVKIDKFSLGLFSSRMRVRGLTIDNPAGFPEGRMLVMPEITVKADIGQAIAGKFYFPLIIINLREAVVIRNKDGRLNIDALKPVEAEVMRRKQAKAQPAAAPEETQKGSPPQTNISAINLKVDVLRLNVERVLFWDYTKEGPPVLEVFDLGLKDKVVTGIGSPADLAVKIVVETLKPTAIRQAGMFAATSLLGVGFLPAAALGVIVAKDDAMKQTGLSPDRTMNEVLKLVERLGKIKRADAKTGQVFALIYDCDVVFTVNKTRGGKAVLRIQVRKYFLPKAAVAAGLMYQFEEQINN